jgi:hypothetical protein
LQGSYFFYPTPNGKDHQNMKLFFALLSSLVFSSAMAQQAPNVIGTWVGETNDAVIGAGTHYPGGKAGEIRFLKEKVSYKFDRQENRTFSGMLTIQGRNIPIVGSFAGDLMSGAMADKDGIYSFKLIDATKISLCFTTTSVNPANKASGPVADCHDVVRK